MKRILIINGPNLNILERRESEYPKITYKELVRNIKEYARESGLKAIIKQSNSEGKIVSMIQKALRYDAIIINACAYTHTSIAILDALKTFKKPIVEVHLTNISEREEYRKKSYISEVSNVTISGKGILGYREALEYLSKL